MALFGPVVVGDLQDDFDGFLCLYIDSIADFLTGGNEQSKPEQQVPCLFKSFRNSACTSPLLVD